MNFILFISLLVLTNPGRQNADAQEGQAPAKKGGFFGSFVSNAFGTVLAPAMQIAGKAVDQVAEGAIGTVQNAADKVDDFTGGVNGIKSSASEAASSRFNAVGGIIGEGLKTTGVATVETAGIASQGILGGLLAAITGKDPRNGGNDGGDGMQEVEAKVRPDIALLQNKLKERQG